MLPCKKKITKLLNRLRHMDNLINRYGDLATLRNLQPEYYKRKEAELKTLLERLEETILRFHTLQQHLHTNYTATYTRWKKEYTWLHRHLRTKHK